MFQRTSRFTKIIVKYIDECNNSVFSTWKHHLDQNKFDEQSFPIKKRVVRNIPLKVKILLLCSNAKVVRTLRGILTRVTRSDFRVEIKSALKSYHFDTHKLQIQCNI